MSTPIKLFGGVSSWEDTGGSRGLGEGARTHVLTLADTEYVDVEIMGSVLLMINGGDVTSSGVLFADADVDEAVVVTPLVVSPLSGETPTSVIGSTLETDGYLNIADNGESAGVMRIENQLGAEKTIVLVALGKNL